MPAQGDNPDGFWENLRFVAINDEILNELGGAWDLPPDGDFGSACLDPMRAKAGLLIEDFNYARNWGWKDPRNSLTLPFWQALLPTLKVVAIVRNPLEVAYSLRERNGTSYSLGLRLWEIYNRRLLAATEPRHRILTRYDSFFEDPLKELKRITAFIGLPSSPSEDAASLVSKKRRHTQFTIEQMVDARVAPEVIELYRELTAEADAGANEGQDAVSEGSSALELLPGSISRLRGSDIRITELVAHLQKQDEARTNLEEKLRHSAVTAARLEEQFEGAQTRLNIVQAMLDNSQSEILQARDRLVQTNQALHDKNVSLAEREARVEELTNKLRSQLKATKKLSRLLDDVDSAAARLRSSRRWKIANPIAALKAMLFPKRRLLGYGHLERVVSTYAKLQADNPDISKVDEAIHALASHDISVLPGREALVPRLEPRPPTEPIMFIVQEKVEVSIIIPVFNKFRFTHACLAALQRHAEGECFEVIVVDDGSTDATQETIEQIPGIVYVRNETNSGFIVSCNRGAEKARGAFLVFLNNDTEVTPGWLRALLETFELEPRAGLVGSKLIFPDGRLQEAGGIIWRDASGWNRGKFDDPEKPEYNFLREADYCSGACLMISKSLFESLGGFDPKYAPAYYEDTDLAFKVRRYGLKVFYQPLSQVIHYEGATGGTDLNAGAKRYQEINRATFAQAWADVLSQEPINADVVAKEALKSGQKRILVIDHHLPTPDRDSGSLRMFQILKILHWLGHRVTFIPDNLSGIPAYARELQKRGIEVLRHPYIKSIRQYLETHGQTFDVVILSRCDFARKHIADVRRHAPHSRVIFDTVDLHFLRQDREADLMQDPEIKRMALEKQKVEYDLIDQADETWVVSEFEKEVLSGARPDKSIEVVSNIVDAPGSATPFSLRHDFLFIGSFQHTPNVDAVIFFLSEIFPLIGARLPEAKFYVIGDKVPPAVVALTNENVIVTGFQPDVRPYFDAVKLSIAPLRWGAGVKGKINQSMGLGVPVVATSVAAEGMELTNGRDVLIADTAEEFAAAMIELYRSQDLWTKISEQGIEKTKAKYSIEAARKQLSRLLDDEHRSSCDSRDRGNDSISSIRDSVDG